MDYTTGLMATLHQIAAKFSRTLRDPAVDGEDLVQAGLVKIMETGLDFSSPALRRQVVRYFVNNCIDVYRASATQRRLRVEAPGGDVDLYRAGTSENSFEQVLIRRAIAEGLQTLNSLDADLVREFFEPSGPVAEAALVRINAATGGHGLCPAITAADVAAGLGVSITAVYRAVKRARQTWEAAV